MQQLNTKTNHNKNNCQNSLIFSSCLSLIYFIFLSLKPSAKSKTLKCDDKKRSFKIEKNPKSYTTENIEIKKKSA